MTNNLSDLLVQATFNATKVAARLRAAQTEINEDIAYCQEWLDNTQPGWTQGTDHWSLATADLAHFEEELADNEVKLAKTEMYAEMFADLAGI